VISFEPLVYVFGVGLIAFGLIMMMSNYERQQIFMMGVVLAAAFAGVCYWAAKKGSLNGLNPAAE